MGQTVPRRLGFYPKSLLVEFYSGHNYTGTGFFSTNLEFFYHCLSTYDPCTLIHPRHCIILAGGSFVLQLNSPPLSLSLSLPV